MLMEQLRLGYACINTVLREDGVFSSRGVRQANATPERLQELTLANISDTKTIVQWNEDNGIRCFRLSSMIFPQFNNPRLSFKPTMDYAIGPLRELGDLANRYGHRLTTHPDHFSYTIVAENPDTVRHAIADLTHQADMLDAMGMPSDSIMCIHGPGTQGDHERALRLWGDAYHRLPSNVRARIALENTEHHYDVLSILNTCERNGVPMVLDWFHNEVADKHIPLDDQTLARITRTWTNRGLRPQFHLSEQAPGLRRGAHGDTVSQIPEALLRFPDRFGCGLDIDIEAKTKEQAVLELYCKYTIRQIVDGRIVYKWSKV